MSEGAKTLTESLHGVYTGRKSVFMLFWTREDATRMLWLLANDKISGNDSVKAEDSQYRDIEYALF
jgi:hypothetical protein